MTLKNFYYLFAVSFLCLFISCDSKGNVSSDESQLKVEVRYPDKDIFDLSGDVKKMLTGGSMWFEAGLYEFSTNGEWTNPYGKLVRDSIYRILSITDNKTVVEFSYNDDSTLSAYSVNGKKHTINRNARDMEKGYDYIAIDNEGNWIGRINLSRSPENRNRDEIRYLTYHYEKEPLDEYIRKEILAQFKNFSKENSNAKYYTPSTANTYSSVYPYRTGSGNTVTLLDIYATSDSKAKGISLVEDREFGITYFAATVLQKDKEGHWRISYMEIINMVNFEKSAVKDN